MAPPTSQGGMESGGIRGLGKGRAWMGEGGDLRSGWLSTTQNAWAQQQLQQPPPTTTLVGHVRPDQPIPPPPHLSAVLGIHHLNENEMLMR